DSLLAVEMLSEVERLTGQVVPSSILLEATTIRQLASGLSEGNGLQVDPLTKLNSNGSQAPLFFFPGDYGGAYVRKLASLLGSDQPLFVIAWHSVDALISRSIETMAAHHLRLIAAAQPNGPYRLAGYCTAGLVAFEAARLLVAAGEKVDMVVMIDTPTISARRYLQQLLSILARALPTAGPIVQHAMVWTWLKIKMLDNLSYLPLSAQWAWAKDKARALVNAGGDRDTPALPNGGGDAINQATSTVLVENALRLAKSNYVPATLAVRVIYFSASYDGPPMRQIKLDLKSKTPADVDSFAESWLRVSSNLEVIKLPCSIMTDPTDLAHYLWGLLRRKGESQTSKQLLQIAPPGKYPTVIAE